jgi:MFS family permease
MHDEGFKPKRGSSFAAEIKEVVSSSIEFGFRTPALRWMMLSALASGGVGIYGFYAMQPYLLELYGDGGGYLIAGLSASMVAGAQIVGGLLVPYAGKLFANRTSLLAAATAIGTGALLLIGLAGSFWAVLVLLAVWALVFALTMPVRQSYMNGLIPSEQRATVLSADNMFNSAGGVVVQPVLGRTAEAWGYPASYLGSAVFQILALPLILLARREKAESDPIRGDDAASAPSK